MFCQWDCTRVRKNCPKLKLQKTLQINYGRKRTVEPADADNDYERTDPLPGYECHIATNPVESNLQVEEKLRRSQVNARETTCLVFMAYS